MTQARRSTQEMYPLVEAYLERDQTQKAFCAENGISTSLLNYWLTKYRKEAAHKPGSFIEILPGASQERALMEVVYPSGVRLRLLAPVAPSYLKSLLQRQDS